MLDELILACKTAKRRYKELDTAFKGDDPDRPFKHEVEYARGIYFGYLAAISIANGREIIRI